MVIVSGSDVDGGMVMLLTRMIVEMQISDESSHSNFLYQRRASRVAKPFAERQGDRIGASGKTRRRR